MAGHKIGLGGFRSHVVASLGALLLGACALPSTEVEGGANANDRSNGGNDGEQLLTGGMVVSPPAPATTATSATEDTITTTTTSAYGLMQRNTVSVLVDFTAGTAKELDFMVDRWLFSPVDAIAYAIVDGELVALSLPGLEPSWRVAAPTFGIALLRVSPDGRTLVLADGHESRIIDAATGELRATVALGAPEDVAFLPDGERALLVGQTAWTEHVPATPVVEVDLFTGESSRLEIPNCAAPITVLPSGTRALLSPTFCQEGVSSTGQNPWTNPDPVSVIDLGPEGPAFVRNLPGFGPVALSEDGARAVAYLDVERVDPALFDDPAQVPDATGPRYHVLLIDPETLELTVVPIGDALPRFAMTRDGASLLVDATVQVIRDELRATVDVTLDESGLHGSLDVSLFQQRAPFGRLDLESLEFVPFEGPTASLDRFVMPRSGSEVYTLRRTADGLGGDLYRIDLETGTTADLGRSLRDLGLLPDGDTLVLRIRSSPLRVDGGVRLREAYCLSLDGVTCEATIEFTSSLVFASEYCADPANYHDC